MKTFLKRMRDSVLGRCLGAGSVTKRKPEFVVTPHNGGFRPGIDTSKLNQLIDQLEVEDFLQRNCNAKIYERCRAFAPILEKVFVV